MPYAYVKMLKEDELAEGENPYSIIRIEYEMTEHYLTNGYELATEEEYASQFKPEAESEEVDGAVLEGLPESGGQPLSDAGIQE